MAHLIGNLGWCKESWSELNVEIQSTDDDQPIWIIGVDPTRSLFCCSFPVC
jgi:hypothetical protein